MQKKQKIKKARQESSQKYENKLASKDKGLDIESILHDMLFTFHYNHNESKV